LAPVEENLHVKAVIFVNASGFSQILRASGHLQHLVRVAGIEVIFEDDLVDPTKHHPEQLVGDVRPPRRVHEVRLTVVLVPML